jgi:hypothetical protein
VPAAYATRLRLEGGVLVAAGVAASAVLIARAPQARRWPASTIGQVAIVAAGLGLRGPIIVAAWMSAAEPVDAVQLTGEPTPLHHVPVPMLLGALAFKAFESIGGPLRPLTRRAGWDAALRVTAGSALVGAAQALLLARTVAEAEAREGRTYFRLPGSRLGTGTRLGYTER